jgi:hypothetical protein
MNRSDATLRRGTCRRAPQIGVVGRFDSAPGKEPTLAVPRRAMNAFRGPNCRHRPITSCRWRRARTFSVMRAGLTIWTQ